MEWQFYHFVVLPFGLACAPRIFSLVMRHCVRYLRALGCTLMAYLDDLPFAAARQEDARRQATLMWVTLQRFGWVLNRAKCKGLDAPLQCFAALGFLVDLHRQTMSVKPEMRDRIVAKASELLELGTAVPVRLLASAKGLILSTWVVTGSVARLRTRSMGLVIEERVGKDPNNPKRSWKGSVHLTAAATAELCWWAAHIADLVDGPMRRRPLEGDFDLASKVDASASGWGGWASLSNVTVRAARSRFVAALEAGCRSVRAACQLAWRGVEAVGAFPADILEGSSTLREMYGLWQFLLAVLPIIRGCRILLGMDNLCSVLALGGVVPLSATGDKEPKSVFGGSSKREVQAIALLIDDLQRAEGFVLEVFWTRRDNNGRADALSHATEQPSGDYMLRRELFARLDQDWGHFTVDRFSTRESAQHLRAPHTGRFCSYYYDADAIAVDAFTVSWTDDVNWCFPPARLALRTLRELLRARAPGTLVIADDPDGPVWPVVFPRGRDSRPADFVRDVRRLGSGADALMHLLAGSWLASVHWLAVRV